MRPLYVFGMTLLLSLLSFSAFAQNTNSYYAGTIEQIEHEAELKKTAYILNFGATWCQPCKKMDREVFSSVEVKKMLGKNFLYYKIDSESFNFNEIASKNGVTAYPTLIFFDENGKELKRLQGYTSKSVLLKELKKLSPKTPNTAFSDFR